MSTKHKIRRFFWSLGYDVVRFAPMSHPMAWRKHVLKGTDTVLDIGANSGQFARMLRADLAYRGKILSFEPLSAAFEQLQVNAKDDRNWEVFNFALGDTEETREINIAGNSYSSSFLDMLPAHLQSEPRSLYVGRQTIEVRTLDSFLCNLPTTGHGTYIKMDTQGFEQRVIGGAERSLASIDFVEMEMSLVPLYEGQMLFQEMQGLMSEKGYMLVAIEPEFRDKRTGRILQVNGMFNRPRLSRV